MKIIFEYLILGFVSDVIFGLGYELYFVMQIGLKDFIEGFLNYLLSTDGKINLKKFYNYTWYSILYAIVFWPINIILKCIELTKIFDSYLESKRETE